MKQLTLRLESYEPDAREAVVAAQALADERGHHDVLPLHLLHHLVERDTRVQDGIEKAGVDAGDVLIEAEAALRRLAKRDGDVAYLATRTLSLLGRAEGEAAREGSAVAVPHLALACAQESNGPTQRVFELCGLSAPVLRSTMQHSPRGRRESTLPGVMIEKVGTDLTERMRENESDPLVGREQEVRRMVQILARRREHNPLLVGEPGVGRRSLVSALAHRIAHHDVPDFLKNRRVVTLDLASLTAGAKLKGQFEERFKALLAGLRQRDGDSILFVPDLAALFRDRASAVPMLAEALGRGEVQMIAVVSPDGLRQLNVDHPELAARFVALEVEEPSERLAIAMLRGLTPRLETSHGLRIADPAVVSAVRLAKRYIPSARLPKAAVDVVDEAAAVVRVAAQSGPSELDQTRRRLETLEIEREALADDDDAESRGHLAAIEEQIAALRPQLEAQRKAWGEKSETNSVQTVQPEHVANVVATWTGVPVSKMLEEEAQKLMAMEATLKRRVIGQDEAVTALSKAVRRSRVGLRDPGRPIGSFLFLGPTGVGKTELAKALAEFLFDDELALTRLDMSEFMEKHMVARLLGSPPGYVDSEEGGFLTEAVRRKPYSVVLFDEMEKAHADVFNILLQVLDDGRLTDSRGQLARFSEAVVIMTSNIGGQAILEHDGPPEELKEIVEAELHKGFRPEFLNRIDDIVIFNPLSKGDLAGIVEILLRRLTRMLAHRRMELHVSDEACAEIVERGYQPAFGARPLKRVILKELQDPLAGALLRGEFGDGDHISVDYDGSGFSFSKIG